MVRAGLGTGRAVLLQQSPSVYLQPPHLRRGRAALISSQRRADNGGSEPAAPADTAAAARVMLVEMFLTGDTC